MRYLTFLKIVLSVIVFLFSSTFFGQSESVRSLIKEDYNNTDIGILENKYSRTKYKARKINLPILNDDRSLIDIDELGNTIKYKTYNKISAIVSGVNQINSGGIKNLNLNGENMILGLWDSGIPRYTHLDLQSKILVKDESGFVDIKNHATHVAGTVVSEGKYSKNGIGRGLAPEAKLWVYNWEDDLIEMINFASQGFLVSNHSYGLDTSGLPEYYYGSYTNNSQAVDAMTYSMKYYLPVIAAGNDRDDYIKHNPSKSGSDLLTGMAVSKNGVVVASIDLLRNTDGKFRMEISGFSNWGPTDDFRIKPDISARGMGVFSTTSINDYSYGFLNGTSMAAPVVSSIFALWQQYYLSLHNESKILTSASVRGIMVHTADRVGVVPGPNHKTGWGLINAAKGTDFITAVVNNQGTDFLSEDILWQGTEMEYVAKLNSPRDLTLTLVWTDREGEKKLGDLDNSRPDLVNDLDIVVKKGDELYYPWRLKKDFNNPIAEQGINDVDNIEKIEIPNAEQGEYTVRISHRKALYSGKQDFSLLISGIDSIEDISKDISEGYKLWPNPVAEFLSISMGSLDMNGGRIDIYDINGKNILQIPSISTPKNTIANIDVSSLIKGVYFVRFEKNKVKKVFKMVKL